MQPRQGRTFRHRRERTVDGVVGADQEIGAGTLQFLRRGQHEIGDTLPVVAIDEVHVLAERVRVHGNLGMPVRAHQGRALVANGAIAERRALGAAGHDSNVEGHGWILGPAGQRGSCQSSISPGADACRRNRNRSIRPLPIQPSLRRGSPSLRSTHPRRASSRTRCDRRDRSSLPSGRRRTHP